MDSYILLIVLAVGVLLGCLLTLSGCKPEPEPEPVPEVHIQNIFEIQELLTEAGYYSGAIDGKWGTLTDAAYCNWCAARSFK